MDPAHEAAVYTTRTPTLDWRYHDATENQKSPYNIQLIHSPYSDHNEQNITMDRWHKLLQKYSKEIKKLLNLS